MSGVGRRLRLYTLQYFAILTSETPFGILSEDERGRNTSSKGWCLRAMRQRYLC